MCVKGWDNIDSSVVCRQLGLPYSNAQLVAGRVFGQSTGPIWLDEVECTGQENSLDECSHDGWGIINNSAYCNHDLDVGVVCTSGKKYSFITDFKCENPYKFS